MEISLTPRLQSVSRLVLANKSVADIGTDHAYLPVYLVQQGFCPQAIAGDRNRGPWLAACRLVEQMALEDRISVRLGDGLSVLMPGEAATVCMAGLGGQTILEILSRFPHVVTQTERLVLQPQRHQAEVRYWLAEHGWRIVSEELVLDNGIYYQIFAAEPGSMMLNFAQAEFGPLLLQQREPLLKDFLLDQLSDCRELIEQLSVYSGAAATVRLRELREREAMILSILKD